jgi:hypothetical protein
MPSGMEVSSFDFVEPLSGGGETWEQMWEVAYKSVALQFWHVRHR